MSHKNELLQELKPLVSAIDCINISPKQEFLIEYFLITICLISIIRITKSAILLNPKEYLGILEKAC